MTGIPRDAKSTTTINPSQARRVVRGVSQGNSANYDYYRFRLTMKPHQAAIDVIFKTCHHQTVRYWAPTVGETSEGLGTRFLLPVGVVVLHKPPVAFSIFQKNNFLKNRELFVYLLTLSINCFRAQGPGF